MIGCMADVDDIRRTSGNIIGYKADVDDIRGT